MRLPELFLLTILLYLGGFILFLGGKILIFKSYILKPRLMLIITKLKFLKRKLTGFYYLFISNIALYSASCYASHRVTNLLGLLYFKYLLIY